MLTKFGKFCRKLRIERNEILRDMAEKLNVTVSYLSAVENGNRAIPEEWKNQIISIYCLSDREIEELELSILETKKEITFKLKNITLEKQEFTLKLARRFDNLTNEEIRKISEILMRGHGNE